MKILNWVQGSKEWIEGRKTHDTASEASAMMGDSKYMSRNDLLQQKKTGVSKPVNAATQRIFDLGHAYEDNANRFNGAVRRIAAAGWQSRNLRP